jgi:hypothetical protein
MVKGSMMEPVRGLRVFLSLYGAVLGVASAWVLVADTIRPPVTSLPLSQDSAVTASQWREAAFYAAHAGAIRGDLWAQLAFTYASLEWTNSTAKQADLFDAAIASAIQTVRLMPGNTEAWLLLADLVSRSGKDKPNPIEIMKMSYYTGSNEDGLVPLRLVVSARLNVDADPELSRLFEADVEKALSRNPDQRAALLSAYKNGSPQARRIIANTVAPRDPGFLRTLQTLPQ